MTSAWKKRSSYLSIKYSQAIRQYSLFIALGIVISSVLIADIIFTSLAGSYIAGVFEDIRSYGDSPSVIDFAPEAWLSLLGLVLGTLIIVISVASQSTPKLIDLYTGDQTSLFYVWYIIVGSVHNMYLQLVSKASPDFYQSSIILNTYLMLPLALLLAVPYVLYILKYTKTSNVIDKIYFNNIKRIDRLQDRANNGLLSDNKTIGNYQFELFEALNQLDDLLAYVSFKEPKGDIMERISFSIQHYITVKKDISESCPAFFKIREKIRPDVSFKTMTGQFDDIEKAKTFYEQKGFRLLGNAYIKLIEEEEFDLASLCAYELSQCGKKAIQYGDEALIDVVLVRFNTLLRFGIKHGLKNMEARNLYNAIFHYSSFINYLIKSGSKKSIKKSCFYLNIYIKEIYGHSQNTVGSFVFLVDVFTWEFKRLLISLNKNNHSLTLQKEILGLFLKIDNLPDTGSQSSEKERQLNTGVRVLQIALALYYIQAGQDSLAESIIIDILSDHEFMGKEKLKEEMTITCNRLKNASPTFWEDTDRGNMNIYFSEEKAEVDRFLEMFEGMLDTYMLLAKRSRNN